VPRSLRKRKTTPKFVGAAWQIACHNDKKL